MTINALCVYCGSSPGLLPEYKRAAQAFGEYLAVKGIVLVYGGGNVGLMGVVADACLGSGGKVIGVIPQCLVAKEVAHQGLTQLHVVANMHERKRMMADLSDGFIALPGGAGTLEEIFEVFTWAQLGLHSKPCGFLNVSGYYDHLFIFLSHMVAHRFCAEDQIGSLIVETSGPAILAKMQRDQPLLNDKWLNRALKPDAAPAIEKSH